MVTQKIRGMVGRFLVIAALALSIGAGSVAVSHPAHASAMPKYTCAQAYQLGQYWQTMGDLYFAWEMWSSAANAYGKASAYYDYC
jgi:hypothetical protein